MYDAYVYYIYIEVLNISRESMPPNRQPKIPWLDPDMLGCIKLPNR